MLEPVIRLVGKLPTTGLSNGVLVLPSPKLKLSRVGRWYSWSRGTHVGVGRLRALHDPGGVGDAEWDVREDEVYAVDAQRAM